MKEQDKDLYEESGSELVKLRLSKKVLHRLQFLAKTYAGGNLSLWLRYAGLEAPRRYLVPPKDRPKRTKKRGF